MNGALACRRAGCRETWPRRSRRFAWIDWRARRDGASPVNGARTGPAGPSGAVGEKGDPGEPAYPGAPVGFWNETESYRAMDVVAFNGSEWRAVYDNPGPLPGDGWKQGAKGVKGKPGERGEEGRRGMTGRAWVARALSKTVVKM